MQTNSNLIDLYDECVEIVCAAHEAEKPEHGLNDLERKCLRYLDSYQKNNHKFYVPNGDPFRGLYT